MRHSILPQPQLLCASILRLTATFVVKHLKDERIIIIVIIIITIIIITIIIIIIIIIIILNHIPFNYIYISLTLFV